MHLVCNNDHCPTFDSETLHDAQDLAYQLWIERRGRFIKEKNFWLHRECSGDRDPLLLPTGKLAWIVTASVAEPHLIQVSPCTFVRFFLSYAEYLKWALHYVFDGTTMRPQIEGLKDHANFSPQHDQIGVLLSGSPPTWNGWKDDAVQDYLPLRWFLEEVDAADQGALTRPGAADQRKDISFRGTEFYALEYLERAE